MNPRSRRLLLTTYFFPPVGGIGVERTLKHVAYLPGHGWQPVVIGAATPGYRVIDPGSIDRIPPGTEVHRAIAPEPAHLRWAARSVVRALGRSAWSAAGALPVPSTTPTRQAVADPPLLPLTRALNAAWARVVPLVFFPDEQLLWAVTAAALGMTVHATEPVQAIYSSSPPISSHLAAALVSSLTGLPWIADFRDPWIGNAFAPPLAVPQLALQRELEAMIVRRATRSVFATGALGQMYATRYPALAKRFAVISNGYDADELRGIPRRRPGARLGPFRLVYTGSLYGERELDLLLDGIAALLAQRPTLRDELRVELVGWLSEANERRATARLPSLDPIVRRFSQVPRAKALALVGGADAGLLLLAGGLGREVFVGAKLFDYIGLDVPVLAVAPDGEARRILADLGWGVLADPTPEGVAQGIAFALDMPPAVGPADPELRFERRGLTAALARLLDEVVDLAV
jgi:glycosyltransferase involved in cell wall biosynthesis